jgi:hypothetical protein
LLTLREALTLTAPPITSVAALATRLGRPQPASLRDLLLASDVKMFRAVISTPAGTALGGWVELEVAGDGRYTFSVHMHDSGFDPYSFRIQVFLRGEQVGLSLRKSGSVGGTIGSGSRDFDQSEVGTSDALKGSWTSLRGSQFEVAKSYEDTGVIGVAEDIAKDFLAFLLTAALVGPWIAAAVVIGAELGQMSGVNFARPDVIAGVLVAGSTVLLCGPGFVIPAIIAGYIAGSQVKQRLLSDKEKNIARLVFADTLPFDRIYVTNIKAPGSDRAFTTPMLDGSILVNLGKRYDNPLEGTTDPDDLNQIFIHELVHAWQLTYAFSPELIWEAAINHIKGEAVYNFDTSKRQVWSEMNIEAQASAVAYWFGLFYTTGEQSDSEAAKNVFLYDYIANHIRLGTN